MSGTLAIAHSRLSSWIGQLPINNTWCSGLLAIVVNCCAGLCTLFKLNVWTVVRFRSQILVYGLRCTVSELSKPNLMGQFSIELPMTRPPTRRRPIFHTRQFPTSTVSSFMTDLKSVALANRKVRRTRQVLVLCEYTAKVMHWSTLLSLYLPAFSSTKHSLKLPYDIGLSSKSTSFQLSPSSLVFSSLITTSKLSIQKYSGADPKGRTLENLDTYRSSLSGEEIDDGWKNIQSAWTATQASGTIDFNRVALAACRAMWAQFNLILMSFGLLLLGTDLCATWSAIRGSLCWKAIGTRGRRDNRWFPFKVVLEVRF